MVDAEVLLRSVGACFSMRFTEQNLTSGIGLWAERRNWPTDFHNRLYVQLAQYAINGINHAWWDFVLAELSRWYATRPVKVTILKERGLMCLNEIEAQFQSLSRLEEGRGPSLSTTCWIELSDLYELARKIKRNQSPVFPSKFCHFIFPRAYVVVDHAFNRSGSSKYEDFYAGCQSEWMATQNKEHLISILRRKLVASGVTPFANYPWDTKVIDLCLAGYDHP